MERDPHISKLIGESGKIPAPGHFTDEVMDKIRAIPARRAYQPLIGRGGRIIILLLLLTIVVVSVIYSEPGGRIADLAEGTQKLHLQMQVLRLNLQFLLKHNLSTWVLSTLAAVFLLLLSDVGLKWHRFI